LSRQEIIAVIPCYNEEKHIGGVVRRVSRFVDRVVVVDDGSSDHTANVAEAAGAVVISHGVNRGKGVAMNTAFQWAKYNGVRAIVLLDGDGQHNPDEIPLVLAPVLQGEADVVVGSRFLGADSRIPGYRVLGQKILIIATNLGSGLRLTDCQSGFRAFSGKAVSTLRFTRTKVGDVECETQFLIKENRLRVTEVPIVVSYDDGAKRNPVVQGLGNLITVLGLTGERLLRSRPRRGSPVQ